MDEPNAASEAPTGKMSRLLAGDVVESFDDYLSRGGGTALRMSLELGPLGSVELLAAAGIRGRGGAGFPAAVKWRSVVAGGGRRHFAVCNAAEGEPGTFKDRALLRHNPYSVLEGLLVAAHAVSADEAFIALKASFAPELARVRAALSDIESAGWCGEIRVQVVEGPEEYLFGEEKALLEVIEGNEPLPRWLPPFQHGLYATAPQLGWESTAQELGHAGRYESNPTLVNNAETLAQVVWAFQHGVAAFRSIGTSASPGTVICTVVGDVEHPGVVEVAMGTPLREVLRLCGAPKLGREIKAVFPGVANAVITNDQLDTPVTHEDLAAIGSGLGSAGFVVYDDTACMVEVAATFSRFLSVESCGQCPPCKLGSGAITSALERLRVGDGADSDVDVIHRSLSFVTDANRCYLPVQERVLVSSILRAFPEDVVAHLEGRCRSDRPVITLPKIVDLADGFVRYDDRQADKQPDWTYRNPTVAE